LFTLTDFKSPPEKPLTQVVEMTIVERDAERAERDAERGEPKGDGEKT
jgi:hypothetical protein